MTLYEECLSLGIPTAHYSSDLYIPVTNQTTELLKKHNIKFGTTFVNQVEGGIWYDVPFNYDPYWSRHLDHVVPTTRLEEAQ